METQTKIHNMENTILFHDLGGKDELKQIVTEAVTEVFRNHNQETKYITRAEACRKYHLSLPSIDKGIKNGTLKAVRFGARILIQDKQD